MMNETVDTFSAPELYLLAAAFDGDVLFGLYEKQIYQLLGGVANMAEESGKFSAASLKSADTSFKCFRKRRTINR